MNDIKVFFNYRIQDNGLFSNVGDMGLVSFRHWFGGRTATILRNKADQPCGVEFADAKKLPFWGAVLRIPLVALVVFKLLAYIFDSEVRANHRFVRGWLAVQPVVEELGVAKSIPDPGVAWSQAIKMGQYLLQRKTLESPPGSQHDLTPAALHAIFSQAYGEGSPSKDGEQTNYHQAIVESWSYLILGCPHDLSLKQGNPLYDAKGNLLPASSMTTDRLPSSTVDQKNVD